MKKIFFIFAYFILFIKPLFSYAKSEDFVVNGYRLVINANLSNADFFGRNLKGSNLSGCDLSFSDLRFSNLTDVNLSFANLNGANLYGADLNGADLATAKLKGVYAKDLKRCPKALPIDWECKKNELKEKKVVNIF